MMADLVARIRRNSRLLVQHARLRPPYGERSVAPAAAAAASRRGRRAGGRTARQRRGRRPTTSAPWATTPASKPKRSRFRRRHGHTATRELIPPRWRWMFVESARRLTWSRACGCTAPRGRVVGHMGSIPVRLHVAANEVAHGLAGGHDGGRRIPAPRARLAA